MDNPGDRLGRYVLGEEDGAVYIAMEFITGHTLADYPDLQEVPWPRRVGWLVDLALALGAAHRAGLVHRDVKPANVMIRDDGVLKVLDFGIARRNVALAETQVGDEKVYDGTVTPGAVLTAAGAVIGTPAYMAPEQLQGREVDGRSDQFAWGVTAYELLTGARAWPLGNAMEALTAILTTAPASLRGVCPAIPNVVDNAVLRTLRPEPTERFESMDALVDVIGMFAETGPRRRPSSGHRTSVEPSVQTDPHAETAAAPAGRAATDPTEIARPDSQPAGPRWPRALASGVTIGLLGVLWVLYPAATVGPPPSEIPAATLAFEEGERLMLAASHFTAWRSYKKAVTLDPTYAAAHLRLASTGIFSTPDVALDHYRQALQNSAADSPWLARTLDQLEPLMRPEADLKERVRRLEQGVEQTPDDQILLSELLLALRRSALHDRSVKLAKELTRRFPGTALSWLGLANAYREVARPDEGVAAGDECLRLSPAAGSCFRIRILNNATLGKCEAMASDARLWRMRDPDSKPAVGYLFIALRSLGAPRPAVEEVARGRAGDEGTLDGKAVGLKDRFLLAVDEGDFVDAIAAGRARMEAIGQFPGATDRLNVRHRLIDALMESGDTQGAADLAEETISLGPALIQHPLFGAFDAALDMRPFLYRAGRISLEDLRRERDRAYPRIQERLGDDRPAFKLNLWQSSYMSLGGTEIDAKDALDALGRLGPLPDVQTMWLSVAINAGRAHALAGDPATAIKLLEEGLNRCDRVNRPFLRTYGRFALGLARERSGDAEGARREYEAVLKRWGDAKPRSITAERTRARLEALSDP